jgi:uncharacterized protein YukE
MTKQEMLDLLNPVADNINSLLTLEGLKEDAFNILNGSQSSINTTVGNYNHPTITLLFDPGSKIVEKLENCKRKVSNIPTPTTLEPLTNFDIANIALSKQHLDAYKGNIDSLEQRLQFLKQYAITSQNTTNALQKVADFLQKTLNENPLATALAAYTGKRIDLFWTDIALNFMPKINGINNEVTTKVRFFEKLLTQEKNNYRTKNEQLQQKIKEDKSFSTPQKKEDLLKLENDNHKYYTSTTYSPSLSLDHETQNANELQSTLNELNSQATKTQQDWNDILQNRFYSEILQLIDNHTSRLSNEMREIELFFETSLKTLNELNNEQN